MLEIVSSLLTLIVMEIVLGIDNVIFIAILVERVEEAKRQSTRIIGLSLALIFRIILLFSITWIMGLTRPFFSIMEYSFSGRDIILLLGGLFLIGKATLELHHNVENRNEAGHATGLQKPKYILGQIVLLDLVFSLDSVITAVGMASHVWVMALAVVISVLVMMVTAESISNFVSRNPTIKILALAFLLLIGVVLTAEGMGLHVPKGYIYFAMAFSLSVELLSMRYRSRRKSHPTEHGSIENN